jgi:hypothetical protein
VAGSFLHDVYYVEGEMPGHCQTQAEPFWLYKLLGILIVPFSLNCADAPTSGPGGPFFTQSCRHLFSRASQDPLRNYDL